MMGFLKKTGRPTLPVLGKEPHVGACWRSKEGVHVCLQIFWQWQWQWVWQAQGINMVPLIFLCCPKYNTSHFYGGVDLGPKPIQNSCSDVALLMGSALHPVVVGITHRSLFKLREHLLSYVRATFQLHQFWTGLGPEQGRNQDVKESCFPLTLTFWGNAGIPKELGLFLSPANSFESYDLFNYLHITRRLTSKEEKSPRCSFVLLLYLLITPKRQVSLPTIA